MANPAQQPGVVGRIASAALALVVVAGAGWATSPYWLPTVGPLLGVAPAAAPADAGHDDHADHDEHAEITTLVLSDEARKTLGVEVRPLKRSPYARIIAVPASAQVVPGFGRREVTSSCSGVMTTIFVGEGGLVTPGQPLFEIQLIHDEGIKVQIELLDALADMEMAQAELKRLQELEGRTPGAVSGSRIIEKSFQVQHLNHLISSRRQMLVLLGLPQADVDAMIKRHLSEQPAAPDLSRTDALSSPLMERVVVYAPPPAPGAPADTQFLLEKLHIVAGQHVDAGTVLCQLGDYHRLLIEGDAFERDLDNIRRVREQGWPVTAAIERRGQDPLVIGELAISQQAFKVDAASRSVRFYVDLTNSLRGDPDAADPMRRVDWLYRPGQRMELRIPLERVPDALKVPVEAVARDGLDNYVFQASGNTFVRRRVQVLHRDEDYAVLAEDRMITAGVPVAMSGAYQLQLALLNKSMDPAALAHGHAH
ncbi:MAG: hypothetical protein KDA41_17675 [Planctomycetales bacterium]|nr:hypothetical protein [Planctomycetales bacterium]